MIMSGICILIYSCPLIVFLSFLTTFNKLWFLVRVLYLYFFFFFCRIVFFSTSKFPITISKSLDICAPTLTSNLLPIEKSIISPLLSVKKISCLTFFSHSHFDTHQQREVHRKEVWCGDVNAHNSGAVIIQKCTSLIISSHLGIVSSILWCFCIWWQFEWLLDNLYLMK